MSDGMEVRAWGDWHTITSSLPWPNREINDYYAWLRYGPYKNPNSSTIYVTSRGWE